MKRIELLRLNHPEDIDERRICGASCCTFRYHRLFGIDGMQEECTRRNGSCKACWDAEIPEEGSEQKMDTKYLDKQKVLDWISDEIDSASSLLVKHAEESKYAAANARQIEMKVYNYFNERIAGGDFDAVIPEKSEQQEVRVGDVRRDNCVDTVYAITNTDCDKDAFYIVFGDGTCSGKYSTKMLKKDELLHHADTWQEAITWMIEHGKSK